MSITPQQFVKRMREINKSPDTEAAHCEADDLMCDLLEELGYKDGVEVFKDMHKWYA